ncbi:predicted protein [Plenodomus lingam JN3]|uniref:Predicted protein n=1 Tax=Leptosphaeria maculans (strain JN3 / isolate v23.1.3 / race Av1-4-5-6-7-8) TaxID=985895 RepID=E5AEC8_LEPMJ|nr:predicted protein [Plenodomus lingam JN3]CBY01567.1 predicted protein [Plenodomus lingam JN3]
MLAEILHMLILTYSGLTDCIAISQYTSITDVHKHNTVGNL